MSNKHQNWGMEGISVHCYFCFDVFVVPQNIILKMFLNIISPIHTVPPNIEDHMTSTDVVAREGSNVTLRCR